MDSIVISTKQLKKTLSSQTKKKTNKVRNVLASPYRCDYWPVLEECQDQDLQNMLEKTLTPARLPGKYVRDESAVELTKTCNALRSSLLLGFNAVSRGIEKNKVSAVIVAEDVVPPKLIIQPIVDMCVAKCVPVVIMPTLKKVTKKSLGFSCIAIGVKSDGSQEIHFKPLREKIAKLSSTFPKPEGPQFEGVSLTPADSMDNSDTEMQVKVESEDECENSSIYLYRSSRAERVFFPKPIPKNQTQKIIPKSDFGKDFISFSIGNNLMSTPVPVAGTSVKRKSHIVSEPKRRKISHYQPLIVKCMQPNPEKTKKIKKKKKS